jgi:tripartite ATP-independent transporter DctM subunit
MLFNLFILGALFLILLLAGVPVAFALGLPAMVYYFLNPGSLSLEAIPHSMTTPLFTYVLIALPAFLLSGRMMNSSGVTNRIFDLAMALVGRFRGGLAHANVVASMFFASMSGTAVGDTGGLGQVEMQMMKKAGYKVDFAAGITAASSVVGPIIPPSVVMVILGATAEISIGRLFLGGVFPGLIMGLSLLASVAIRAHFTKEGKSWPITVVPMKEIPKSIGRAFFPMLTPAIILGGITMGVVTPTEAAVLAIDYALLLGLFYRELTWKSLWETLEDTVCTTGVFMFIIAVAGFYTWILTREGLPQLIGSMLNTIGGDNQLMVMMILCAFLLVAGCFLDTTAAILLITPTLLPIVRQLGIDPVYFGVVMIIALVIGIITPPFGICIFVMNEVSGISVSRITKEVVKYIPAMVITLLLTLLFPGVITWLPNLVFK